MARALRIGPEHASDPSSFYSSFPSAPESNRNSADFVRPVDYILSWISQSFLLGQLSKPSQIREKLQAWLEFCPREALTIPLYNQTGRVTLIATQELGNIFNGHSQTVSDGLSDQRRTMSSEHNVREGNEGIVRRQRFLVEDVKGGAGTFWPRILQMRGD